MACSEGRKLQEYLSDELSPQERACLEQHLGHCSACREELAQLRQLEQLLAELAPQSPPRGFVCETLLRARHELAPTRHYRPVRGGLVAATGAAAALLMFVLQVGLSQAPVPYAPVVAVAPLELAAATPVVPLPRLLTAGPRRPQVAVAAAPVHPRSVRVAARTSAVRLARAVPAPAAAPAPRGEGAESQAAAAYIEATRHASGDPELSVAALENVAAAYPESRQAAKALLAAANLQRQRGNVAEADGAYRRVLALRSDNGLSAALAHKGLAELRASSVGEDEVALYHYTEAARSLRRQTAGHKPASQAQALVVLADIEKSMGQRHSAAADYAAVVNSGARSIASDQTTSALAEVL